MYCRKCGKQIDYDAPLCKECEQVENYFKSEEEKPAQTATPVDSSYSPTLPEYGYNPNYSSAQNYEPAKEKPKGSRTEGLGGAIASAILGEVAFVLSIFALVFAELTAGFEYSSTSYMGGVTKVFIILTLIAMAFSIFLGIKSIVRFARAKRENRLKPIATLICGIAGVAMNAVALLYLFLSVVLVTLI